MSQKIHISLNTGKLDESVRFYTAFLGVGPVKQKPGYAKFELETPGLNLTLMEKKEVSSGDLNHLGIQVASSEDVWAAKRRLEQAGMHTRAEKDVDCCYALQDKVWVADPNGHSWEIFVVKVADTASNPETEAGSDRAASDAASAAACCAPVSGMKVAAAARCVPASGSEAEECCAPASAGEAGSAKPDRCC